jgi:hypothetical protein
VLRQVPKALIDPLLRHWSANTKPAKDPVRCSVSAHSAVALLTFSSLSMALVYGQLRNRVSVSDSVGQTPSDCFPQNPVFNEA